MTASSLPNMLALFRIVATGPLIWLIVVQQPTTDLAAALLLLLMAISDIIDGPLARRMGVVSPLGIFLDTISDKIFIAGALIPMVERNLLWSWVAVLIIGRDYLISALRAYAASRGEIIAARPWGKQKMVLTTAAIIWFLLKSHADQGGLLGAIPGVPTLLALAPYVLALALIWTVGSAVEYLFRAWPMLRSDWAPQARHKTSQTNSKNQVGGQHL